MESQIDREKRREKFLTAAKPFLDAKAAIYQNCGRLTYCVDQKGELSHADLQLTPEQKESVRLADEAIDHIRSSIFSEEFKPWNRK